MGDGGPIETPATGVVQTAPVEKEAPVAAQAVPAAEAEGSNNGKTTVATDEVDVKEAKDRVETDTSPKVEVTTTPEEERRQTIELLNAIYADIPELGQIVLKMTSTDGNVPAIFAEKGAEIVQEAEVITDVAQRSGRRVLGLDLQIGALQLELWNDQQDLQSLQRGDPRAQEIEEKAANIREKILVFNKEREVLKLTRVVEGVSKEVAVPNQLSELAQALGVTGPVSQEMPLVGIATLLNHVVEDPSAQEEFFKGIKREIVDEKGIKRKMIDEETISLLKKFLDSEHLKQFIKEKGALGIKIAGGMSALMLFFAWMASKKEMSGQQRQQ